MTAAKKTEGCLLRLCKVIAWPKTNDNIEGKDGKQRADDDVKG